MRYLKIYNTFFKQYLKSLVTYRVDFLIGMLAFFLTQSLGILFIYVIFENINSLGGFTIYEVILMYGIGQIPKGIDHLFFDNIWLLPRKVKNGQLDRYLLRPINPLYTMLVERFQPDAFGEIIIGIAMVIYAVLKGAFYLTFVNYLALFLFIIITTFIFTAIKLITASTSFWLKDSYPLMQITYDMNHYTKYPLNIFPKLIRFILVAIIPFSLASYYPTLYLLNKMSFLNTFLMLGGITLIFVILSLYIWKLGLKRYESAGS